VAHYWVWPLPPSGPVAFIAEWPSYGIPESRVEVEAQLIIDAAARALRLWPATDEMTGWAQPERDASSSMADRGLFRSDADTRPRTVGCTGGRRRMLRRSCSLGLGPDPKLVAAGVGEVESASAREIVRPSDNVAACVAHRLDGLV